MERNEATVADGQTVGLIMGSESDWKTMRFAANRLDELGIRYEKRVVSAHRTPVDLFKYADGAEGDGLSLIIAGAGGAAHLPGMTASKTIVPVIGVSVIASPLGGIDALLSIMQMPAGVGVAAVGVGPRGADRAALLAGMILARESPVLLNKLREQRADMDRNAQPDRHQINSGQGYRVVILAEDGFGRELLDNAVRQFEELEVPHSTRIVGRDAPAGRVSEITRAEEEAGAVAFIAGSGRGIELACKVARFTILPVFGVPIVSRSVDSIDGFVRAFLNLPPGVATFAVGRAGAINAALFAATILSAPGSTARKSLRGKRDEQAIRVRAMRV